MASGPNGRWRAKPALVILNNTNWTVYGKLRISIPQGWEVFPRAAERPFSIEGEDQSTTVPFEVRAPSGTPPGEYEVRFEVLIGKDSYPVAHKLTVPTPPAQAKPEPKPPAELP